MNKIIGSRIRLGCMVSMATMIALAASGCGGSSAPGSATSHSASATPKASASPTEKLLTGTKMKSLLLPANAMPKGLKLDVQSVRNTGDSISPDAPSTVPPRKVCVRLSQTSWIEVGGIDSASFAENDYVDASHTIEFAQEIDAFHGDDAGKVMSALWAAFGRCATFTDHSNGMTIHNRVVRSRLHGLGDAAIKAVVTSPTYQGGATLVAIMVGNTIATTLYSSPGNDKGAAAVRMAEKIANNVQSAN